MARPSKVHGGPEQAVRRYFGISQTDLAHYLGLTQPQLSRCESGHRFLPRAAAELLDALERQLPAPETAAPAPPLPLPSPEPGPLQARLDYCQHHARRLRRELRPLEERARQAQRWQQALPAIQATLPPDPGPERPAGTGPAARAEVRTWLRWRWLEQVPTEPLSAEESAQYHLLRLQAEALETEAAALLELLGPENTPDWAQSGQ